MESRWCKTLGSSIGWHELLVGKFQDCPCIIRAKTSELNLRPTDRSRIRPSDSGFLHQPSPRFHYTTKGNFNAICSSAYLTPELYSALKDADGSVFELMVFFFKRRMGSWRSLGNHALDFFGVRKNWWCLRFGEGAANIQPEDANESAICLFRWIFQITSTSWWVDILGHAGSGLWGCLK